MIRPAGLSRMRGPHVANKKRSGIHRDPSHLRPPVGQRLTGDRIPLYPGISRYIPDPFFVRGQGVGRSAASGGRMFDQVHPAVHGSNRRHDAALADREELSRALMAGDSLRQIATRLGRAVSTVTREVARNGHRYGYRAWQAEKTGARRARRPKREKLATHSPHTGRHLAPAASGLPGAPPETVAIA